MRLAIIADVHDNIWSLARVLKAIDEERSKALLVLGDLCAPFTMRAIADAYSGPVHVIFGNNDGDHLHLGEVAAKAGNIELHYFLGELTLGGAKIAIVHYPEVGKRLAASGEFQATFFGHTHVAEVEMICGCLALNPGEVMGRFGRVTYAIYDTETGRAAIREV